MEEKNGPRTKEQIQKEYDTYCGIVGDMTYRIKCLERNIAGIIQHMGKLENEVKSLNQPKAEPALEGKLENGEKNVEGN